MVSSLDGHNGCASLSQTLAKASFSQPIQVIAPPLHHPHPLVPVVPAIVGAADGITIAVGQRAFDGVGMPQAAFVEHGRGSRAEAVGGHFVLAESHADRKSVV